MTTEENYYLTVLSPIDYRRGRDPSRLAELEQTLATTAGPFASIATVHMARFLVIDEIPIQMGNPRSDQLQSKYLLFIAELDGEPGAFLNEVYNTDRDFIAKTWGNCLGLDAHFDSPAFQHYITAHSVETTLPYSAYPGATQQHIAHALATRERLTNFIVDHQTSSAADLFASWQQFERGLGD